jgi:hypothetical protein
MYKPLLPIILVTVLLNYGCNNEEKNATMKDADYTTDSLQATTSQSSTADTAKSFDNSQIKTHAMPKTHEEEIIEEAIHTKGAILNAISEAKDARVPLTVGTPEHKEVNNTITKLEILKSTVDRVIEEKIISLLKSTNNALKQLIKDINVQKDKLESLATKIQNVSSIVTILTNIVASPIFKDVQPPLPPINN